MTDDSSSKPSRCSLTGFLTASGLKPPQKRTSSLFQEFKDEGLITKQKEKPNMTLDLRHPQLVHLYSSENETIAHNEPNGLGKDEAPGPSSAVSSPSGIISRPQMARRGGHFRGVNVRGGRPRSEMISDDRDGMPDRRANSGSIRSHRSPQFIGRLDPNRNPESCAASYVYSDLGVNPKSTHGNVSNQVSCSTGHTDVIDITAFTQSDQNFPNLSMPGNASVDVSNMPSTIIHLKMVAPSSGREESEASVIDTQSMNYEKAETCSSTPSGKQEGNLDSGRIECLSKDSMSFVNPDQNVDGRATKRKLGDVSDCDSSSTSDDDLPLIVHCKRSRKIASREGSSKDGRPMHEVKRTYERAITAQHGSGGIVGRADDPQKAVEKRGVVYEKSRGGVPVVAESGGLGLEMSDEPWKRSARPQHSEGSSPRQRQLEEYERNSYAMRSVTDGKTSSPRKARVPGKSPSNDGESQRNSKRNPAAGQTKKGLAPVVVATKKARLLRCLRPGPVSMKRRRMKEFGVNPKMMSQVLKELTERRSRVGWTSKSFLCNSHQNYYDGYLVFRLTESLPAREKVTVRVPVESRDDLDPVGSESIVLWRMSDGEVDELQKQVKQEMEHKRTEHIMPVVLQMSYDQIETAYEQVKKDMKTYEITEKDSDVEEEDDEEDREKDDDEAEDEDGEESGKGDRRAEEGVDKVEELENDTDENLHVRSYEIIVHDESSKTISCETVKYLEWRKKHPSLDNCESEALRKEAENPRLFETGVENDPPFESPNAAKLVDPISEQTNYSRSRPKRHAVDYSPDAFAPIRLMEGKRLGGKKATPAKPSARKKAVSDVCQGKPSLTSSRDTSEGGDVNCDHIIKGGEKNHKNGSSGGEVRKSKGSAKRQSRRRQKLPKSPQRKLETTSCDITAGKNALSTTSPDREPLARDDNHNADVESDDEIPVILDVSDMPLSPAASSPAVVPEQIPVLCEHNNYVEKQPSAYDAVRNEYIRLRDLNRTAAEDNAVISSDVPVSAAGDNGEDCDVEMCGLDEKLRRETIEHHVPLLSGDCFVDEQNRSRENSDLSHEASAPTQNAANGVCAAANMPSLQRDGGGHVLGAAAAEELMAPPDLGLPIGCVNSQQRPASPVLPPVLQVEASEMNDSGDSVAEDGRCSFPLLSSSESVGGGGDTVALREPIAGDVR